MREAEPEYDNSMPEYDDCRPVRNGARSKPGYVRHRLSSLSRQDSEKIGILLSLGKSSQEIASEMGLAQVVVNRAIGQIDTKAIRRIRKNPDRQRGRFVRILDEVIEGSMKDQPVLDRKGNPVINDGKLVMSPPKASDRKTVIAAIDRSAKLTGLDAPSQSMNVNLKADAILSPELIRKVIGSARGREALMMLEQVANEFDGSAGSEIVVEATVTEDAP